jgi:hypothetical protein
VQHEFVVDASQQRYTAVTLRRRFETAKYVMHKKKTDWSSCAHCEPGQFKQVSFYVNTVNGGLRAKIMTIFFV